MTKARNLADNALSTVSPTELGFLDGVTSAVQTQIDGKTGKSTLTTTGDIYYASAANTPARLAIGSTSQVLTVAAGIPSWAAAAGGSSGFTFITRQTFSAVETADIDSVFDNTYETYLIVVETCFSSVDEMDLQIQFRYAGPTTQTTDYYGRLLSVESTYTTVNTSNAASGLILRRIRTSRIQASNGAWFINQVGNDSEHPILHGTGHCGSTLGPNLSNTFQNVARNYTGFRLFSSTGNLTAEVSIYGLAKS